MDDHSRPLNGLALCRQHNIRVVCMRWTRRRIDRQRRRGHHPAQAARRPARGAARGVRHQPSVVRCAAPGAELRVGDEFVARTSGGCAVC